MSGYIQWTYNKKIMRFWLRVEFVKCDMTMWVLKHEVLQYSLEYNIKRQYFIEIIGKMLSQRIKYTSQVISKYLTHPNYYVLMTLGNIMRVEILNLNFSLKDALKNEKQNKKILGLRYMRNHIVHKLHSKFKIHKNCT